MSTSTSTRGVLTNEYETTSAFTQMVSLHPKAGQVKVHMVWIKRFQVKEWTTKDGVSKKLAVPNPPFLFTVTLIPPNHGSKGDNKTDIQRFENVNDIKNQLLAWAKENDVYSKEFLERLIEKIYYMQAVIASYEKIEESTFIRTTLSQTELDQHLTSDLSREDITRLLNKITANYRKGGC